VYLCVWCIVPGHMNVTDGQAEFVGACLLAMACKLFKSCCAHMYNTAVEHHKVSENANVTGGQVWCSECVVMKSICICVKEYVTCGQARRHVLRGHH